MAHAGAIPWTRLILGAVIGVAVAILIVVLVGPLALAQIRGGTNYRINDSAMAPALVPGDWVLAEALPPGKVPPRGAVVSYVIPGEMGREQIRRVIGLPGETVQIRGGAVYINGRRAGMERVEDRVLPRRREAWGLPPPLCINEHAGPDDLCHQEVWLETLPDGVTTRVLNTRRKIGLSTPGVGEVRDDTSLLRVPHGQVFLLGDNRDLAIDSRMALHGPVPVENLQYRVIMIHTSLDRSKRFMTPRWDRFFREVE